MTRPTAARSERAFVVLTPCYNDWDSLSQLLPQLAREAARFEVRLRVLVVDDCSSRPYPAQLSIAPPDAIESVQVLSLLRNLGHQRAICVGLCQIVSDPLLSASAGIVVMDSDGEDAPHDVGRLLETFMSAPQPEAVFAKRTRRSEGFGFRFFYALYRASHRVLTGIPVQIGNFSVISMQFARRLSVSSDLWSHYAAAAVQSRQPMQQLPTPRAERLSGSSNMSFVALVSHGLAAMAVFADRIGVRSLVTTLVATLALALGLLVVIGIRLYTTLAIPGWATTAAGVLTLLLMQSLLLALVFAFLIHLGRSAGGFVPARDAVWYVDRVETLWSAP